MSEWSQKLENMVDVTIIGGGVAGMTAALYVKRSGKKVRLIESTCLGGQILSAPKVENFPGFTSISGEDLADNIATQLANANIISVYGEVKEIKEDKTPLTNKTYYKIKTDTLEFQSKTVIIATGARHKELSLIDNTKNKCSERYISYCAVCDGAFYLDKTVAVIGDGNSALQYSLMLSDICSKVYLCTLTENLFGDDSLKKSIETKANIEHIKNVNALSLDGEYEVERLILESTNSDNLIELAVNGIFVAIGQVPNTEEFKNFLNLDEYGYIDNFDTATMKQGIFAAGDCRYKKSTRQAITAASDGAVAAMKAVNYLNKNF